MKQNFFILLAMFGLIGLTGCSLVPQASNNQNEVANPASEYCEQNGGILELVPDESGSRGKCNFEDGSFCEERAYFHGECSPGWGDGNTLELEVIQEMQNDESLSQEAKEEISDLVEEIQEHEEMAELTTCTADVKECDDGSYVSRGGPDCEFSLCPGEKLEEKTIETLLDDYEATGSELSEEDIDLMHDVIDVLTQ